MIPIFHNGTAHNRAVLEDMLATLEHNGIESNLGYGVLVNVDVLVHDLEALFERPVPKPVPWWGRFIRVGDRRR